MPVCPKCHKLISPGKYSRHLGRCGVRHKHKSTPLKVHGYSDFYFSKNPDYGNV
jgi:hypothetical protein